MKIKFNKKLIIISSISVSLILILSTFFALRYFHILGTKEENNKEDTEVSNNQKEVKEEEKKEPAESYPYTLVSYKGTVFGAKVPQEWNVTSNESGIEIVDPTDPKVGVSGVVAVGWYGHQTPDGFISILLDSIGASNVQYENESAEAIIKDPISGLNWVMKTKTFTFYKDGQKLKAKASAGVINGYGQFMGMMIAFQTTLDKWSKWAPTLERIAQSITIIDPTKAGGIDKVRLPSAADLANDSSPLMEAWEYRNRSQEYTSHEFSDAILGQESDLVSPSTGQSYTLPLTSYDPTVGGYRNPDNLNEILNDLYE